MAITAGAALSVGCAHHSLAQAVLRINVPKHSSLTPVQRLNREGVEAVDKHDYAKAAGFFYKAYLYDPADPFTLNNLGYISELQGETDRAERFYQLAAEQGCDADIDLSNVARLEGQPMQTALARIVATAMRVNRLNTEAVRLLSQDRGFQAIAVLNQALVLNPRDPFTLNNLGVANEAVADYDDAMRDYAAAADSHSSQAVVVAQERSWQGKPVSAMADANMRRLQDKMEKTNSAETEALVLSLRGVFAENENDWPAARQDFMKAYSLDPSNAFALNNRGYVAERDGDLESAQFFYEKAGRADDAGLRVGVSTHRSAEGKALSQVAGDSDQKVDAALEVYSQQRREQTGPVVLTPRNNGSTDNSTTAPKQPSSPDAAPVPSSDGAPDNPR